jgi:Rad3-related DNA helicase
MEEVALAFYDFIDESFFSFEKADGEIFVNIVTTNLKKRFQELVKKNKVFVLMSGTLHSDEVLRDIFGISSYKIIEAETKHQGELIKCKHGYEIDCKFSNFQSEKITREQYLKTLSKTVAAGKKPIVVHLTSFHDLPDEQEKLAFQLENLPTQQDIINEQRNDPLGERVREFKNKQFPILFTTKCTRGIDFPGDTCNSIIISRFPYPNISSLFWRILKRTTPEHFMEFYMDKAHRELLQKIYRGLRSKNDRVYLLSPDSRVLNFEI